RLFRIAPRDQVHIIVYDDLVADPRAVCADTLRFLGLDFGGNKQLAIVNASVRYRLPFVQTALVRLKRVRKRLGIPGGLGIHGVINHMNMTDGSTELRPGFRRELQDYFREDVELLSHLLSRDLCYWVSAD